MNETEKKVATFIRRHGLLHPGCPVVVGVSGGPDSVCLAVLLHKLGHDVVAAHCNFHLRDEESMRDERFVERLCQQLGMPLRKTDFDTAGYASTHQVSVEMAARELRYGWFRRLKAETGAEAIAVGHHQNDNAETLLLNLARGTGIRGMCGMQPRNGDVVRPLLCLTREEILAYLQARGADFVTDHTNQEDAYARNKVRLHVMPVLEHINPGALHNLTSSIENLNEAQKVYRQAIETAIRECCTETDNGELRIKKPELLRQPSPISVLHETLSPLGFNRQQLKDILTSIDENGTLFEAQGRRLLVDRECLVVEGTACPPVEIRQEILPVKEVNLCKSPRFAYLDADKLHGPLTLRTPRPGDSFAPFGMQGKRKLLSDYLTDQKLNRFEKERQPLLMDGEEIAWVVGRRSSELYRIDENTQRVVVVHI